MSNSTGNFLIIYFVHPVLNTNLPDVFTYRIRDNNADLPQNFLVPEILSVFLRIYRILYKIA